jgi:hypothetical protein
MGTPNFMRIMYNTYLLTESYVFLKRRCVSAGTLVLNYGVQKEWRLLGKTNLLLSSKTRPRFRTHNWSWNEQKYDHVFRRGPQPRMAMLSKASTELLLCSGRYSEGQQQITAGHFIRQ